MQSVRRSPRLSGGQPAAGQQPAGSPSHLPLDVWDNIARFLEPADKKALGDVNREMRARSAAWWDGADRVSIKFKAQGGASQQEYDFLLDTLCSRMRGIRQLAVCAQADMTGAILPMGPMHVLSMGHLRQYGGLDSLEVAGVSTPAPQFTALLTDLSFPPTLTSLVLDTVECATLKRAICQGELAGLRRLVLRNTNDYDYDYGEYEGVSFAKLPSLQSLTIDNFVIALFGEPDVDLPFNHLLLPPSATSLRFVNMDQGDGTSFSVHPDPQNNPDPDNAFFNLAALTALRHLTLESFSLFSFENGMAGLAGLRSLEVQELYLADQADAVTYLDPSTMPQLTRLHVVGNSCVDLRHLPASLRELHIDLSCARLPSDGNPFNGPIMSLDGEMKGDLVAGQFNTRAFWFDGIGFDSCLQLSRLVFAGGLVDTGVLRHQLTFPHSRRLASMRGSLRELYFIDCGMCVSDLPYEAPEGSIAAAPALFYATPATRVPEPSPEAAFSYFLSTSC